MPLDTETKKVLLIGSGPIVISQGCEFDYSGTQACKALKEEGCKVILVNPNPATIMTDPEVADVTYVEPINKYVLEEIIKKERPDTLLPTMGGQTALNAAMELEEAGILSKYEVRLIGVNSQTIKVTEDRSLFRNILEELGVWCPKALVLKDSFCISQIESQLNYPIIVRTSYTLGGSGSGIAHNREQLYTLLSRIKNHNYDLTLLLEEALIGWKEYELEVMVDKAHNFIVVCPIENLDPLGVHTGDSITIAPILTLTDKEYQKIRNMAQMLLKRIGITSGGCNVQFAVNPIDGCITVIEINPRVSRSSALASKVTGFPIAKVATKIALGYALNELSNEMTDLSIPASFEPSIDYVVAKVPRFNFDKYPGASTTLTTQMKSIGEAMGIGRTFQEALQKALRSTEMGDEGISQIIFHTDNQKTIQNEITKALKEPNERRIFYIATAFNYGWDIEQVYELTKIDRWFLAQIKDLAEIESKLTASSLVSLSRADLIYLKQKGFSDAQIARNLGASEEEISDLRRELSISPSYKHVDSCAAEFLPKTSFMYSCYDQESESFVTQTPKIIVLGSGPNRIGQGIEFDYCCVHTSLTVRKMGYEAIMVNNNPETVSTDYDCSDRLYFEPLTYESIKEIVQIENPVGILAQSGGQTSLLLGQKLAQKGFKILGTPYTKLQVSEDRIKFKTFLDKIDINQPRNIIVNNIESALRFAADCQYPLLIRPSFVIGGYGFIKIREEADLVRYFACIHSCGQDVLIEKFMADAMEIDLDAISDGNDFIICGILEQLEEAGVHSGDSICINPAQLSQKVKNKLIEYTHKVTKALHVKGFINIQFLVQHEEVYMLEVNLRASRTIPFLCKSTGVPFVKIATRTLLGESLDSQSYPFMCTPSLVSIKKPIFSCHKFPEATLKSTMEMRSTGEIMAIGKSRQEALRKLQQVPYQDIKLYPLQQLTPNIKEQNPILIDKSV